MFRKKRRQIGLPELSLMAFSAAFMMFHEIVPANVSVLIIAAAIAVYLVLRHKERQGEQRDQVTKR